MFNKDLEEIKKSQYIMNNAINDIKNTLEGTNSRITEAEDRVSEVADRMVEINETERNLHNKEEPQTARIWKGHPKYSNINKMKRQRNTQQVKEHYKCPPNKTKEEETGSLPEKEFRIMIVK